MGAVGKWIASSFASVFSRTSWTAAAKTGLRGGAKIATVGVVGTAGATALGGAGSVFNEAVERVGDAAEGLGLKQPDPEKSELSGQAALVFGGLAGLIGLVGGWISGAPTGTLALLAGGLAVVGAMGGAALGGDVVKKMMAPSQDKAPADNAKGTGPEQAQAAEAAAAAAAAQKAAAEAAAKKPATEQKTAMLDEPNQNPNANLPINKAGVEAFSKSGASPIV